MTSVLILLSGFDPGTYFIEDDGIPGNGIAQLRGPDGSVIFFNIPTEFLTVTASAGRSVVINLTESFGSADINIGSLTNAAENPDSITVANIRGAGDVMLVSNGAITELGSDVGADITANSLILSAGTGVGTPGNAIETQVGTLEAETNTGGINLANFGNLVIGGLTDDVAGLDVNTSGDLTLVNMGSIVLSEESPGGFESVHGGITSGNVTLTANGFDADIVSNVDQDAIAAPGGSITLTAGRDISMGTLGLNFDNDIRARGDLILNAGRDLNIDGFADLASDGFGAATGGDVIVNAGRDINVLNSTGTDGSIGAEGTGGGDTILNAGPGGFVRLLASSTATLFSSSGDVTVNADRMVISATAGITANSGVVTINPQTDGWLIDLGSATDGAFALELSDAELDRIFTTDLVIGDGNTGPVTVTAAVSPAGATNVTLRSGTDLNIDAALTVTGLLSLRATENIFAIAASTITAGTVDALVDELDVDGGTAIFNGAIVSPSITLNGNGQADTLNGSSAGETLLGNGGNDTLRGFGGNDSLNGGAGSDTMEGGLGDDFFFIDVATDVVIEAIGEGSNDRIFSPISYTLTPGSEVDILSTTNPAATTAINFTGNALTQTIVGNAGANSLDSGGGGDTMQGLGGNDFYFTRNTSDRAVEAAAAGTDRVFAAVSFVLEAGSAVETLSTIDAVAVTAINLTGNALTQSIVGNAGANSLDSGGGNDTMQGFGGDDFYFVRAAGDRAVETAGNGTDRVFAALSFTLEAGSSIETFTTVNAAAITAINLTGNALVQAIFGNAGNNTLDGNGGGDAMTGLGGDDFYMIRNAADRAIEAAAAGNDRIFAAVSFILEAGSSVEIMGTINAAATTAINLTGNALTQTIVGNAGANSLDSGGGGDTMQGLGGNDFYFARGAGDRAVEAAAAGTDRVFAAVSFILEAGSAVETLSTVDAAAVTAINLTGNALTQSIIGNAGANSLDSGGGADTMQGFGGDDFYFVRAAGDRAVETAGNGTDRVFAAVSFILEAGSSLETLSTIASGAVTAIDLTGNELAQALLGNAGVNVLDGKGGLDTMTGLGGADTFRFTTALGAGNVDLIADFLGGTDEIALDNAVFTGLAGGALPASAFAIGSATTAAHRILYNNTTGALFFDADGNGAGAAVHFATLQGAPVVAASDFTVI